MLQGACFIRKEDSISTLCQHSDDFFKIFMTQVTYQRGAWVISMAICPECGKSYTSGGVTRTTVSYPSQQNTDAFKGQLMDMRV